MKTEKDTSTYVLSPPLPYVAPTAVPSGPKLVPLMVISCSPIVRSFERTTDSSPLLLRAVMVGGAYPTVESKMLLDCPPVIRRNCRASPVPSMVLQLTSVFDAATQLRADRILAAVPSALAYLTHPNVPESSRNVGAVPKSNPVILISSPPAVEIPLASAARLGVVTPVICGALYAVVDKDGTAMSAPTESPT